MHDDTHYSVIFYKSSYFLIVVSFYFGDTWRTEETFSVTGRISVIDTKIVERCLSFHEVISCQ
jgi:hypothetical protein